MSGDVYINQSATRTGGDGIEFGANWSLYRSDANAVVLTGKPTLRYLLRYWWRSGRKL